MMRILIFSFLGIALLFVFLLAASWLIPRPDISTPKQKVKAERLCELHQNKTPPREFSSDGCTMWPDAGIKSCCLKHDMKYWCGGSFKERRSADLAFMQCIRQKERAGDGLVEYLGLKIGGSPFLPFSWRWGYGWSWPKYKS